MEPTYPPLARAARVQGDVVLSAVIDTNGQIQNLQLVSGHPMLVPAALDGGQTMALQTVSFERATGRSGDHHHRDLTLSS